MRASRAFSPAGTRNASTCASRAPIVFCLMPPIGPTEPSGRISPGRGDLVAVHDVPAELLEDVEREREPGGRPADVARVDAHGDRQVDVDRGLEERRRRSRGSSSARRPCGCSRPARRRPRRIVNATVSPGLCFAIAVDHVRARLDRLAVDRGDDVVRLELADRGRARDRPRRSCAPIGVVITFLPAARSATAAATCCEFCMSCEVDLPPLLRRRRPGGLIALAG